MDIEFIEEKYREDVFELMEMLHLEMAQAYQLLLNADFNKEQAAQRYLAQLNGDDSPARDPASLRPSLPGLADFPEEDSSSESHSASLSPETQHHLRRSTRLRDQRKHAFDEASTPKGQYEDNYEAYYQLYAEFRRSGKPFPAKYPVPRRGLLNKLTSYFSAEPHQAFRSSIERIIKKPVQLEFRPQSVLEALEGSWKDKFPVMVHVVDFKSPNAKKMLEAVYGDEEFVKMINEQCVNIGVDIDNYTLEEGLRGVITIRRAEDSEAERSAGTGRRDAEEHVNYLVLFRINALDEIRVLMKVGLGETLGNIRNAFKTAKSRTINIVMMESYMQQQYQHESNGDFHYQRPPVPSERRKLNEDRKLRSEQERTFQQILKETPVEPPSSGAGVAARQEASESAIAEGRRRLRSSLPQLTGEEKAVMQIKLRMPNGSPLLVSVSADWKVQYLFDLVESEPNDLGFDNEKVRRFNCLRPYDKLSLLDKKDLRFGEVFEGSEAESLVVSELTDS